MNQQKFLKFPFSIFLLVFAILQSESGLSNVPMQSSTRVRDGKDYALFFAVRDYDHWSDLKNPIRDAEAIASLLREEYGFEEIRIEPNPSFQTIIKTLTNYQLKGFDPEDQLFIFFSGHGTFNDLSKEGFFIPSDAQKDDPLQNTYLPLTRLERNVGSIPCKHILLIIDACYSGTFNETIALSKNDNSISSTWMMNGIGPENQEAKKNWIKMKLEKRSRLCITSGGKERTSDGIEHSPLTEAFLRNLRDPGDDAILTADELTASLRNIQPEPKSFSFGIHDPDGSFLFVRKEEVVNFNLQSYENRQKDLEAWKKAKSVNTTKAFQDYLKNFPKGSFRREAYKALGEPEENLEWELARSINTPESYQSYLSKYPSGKYSTLALKLMMPEFNMVLVRGGTFTMGCTGEQGFDCDEDEKPAHEVTLSDFYIGKYEVTQKEWRQVMGSNPSIIKNCDNCPVERVSWEDIQQFLTRLNANTGKAYRLPTEAEWEYAARGGSFSKGYKFAGSSSRNGDDVAWHWFNSGNTGDQDSDESEGEYYPVGQKKANELGLYDFSGNVNEWCQDWYSKYSAASQVNPKGPNTGYLKVRRGGSWFDPSIDARVSNRNFSSPNFRDFETGFRLAHGL
jgi:formylglycine-generating enzyme required for sulfatase activity